MVVTLLNGIGQSIYSGKDIEKVDFSSLKHGIYFLKITHQGKAETIKVSK